METTVHNMAPATNTRINILYKQRTSLKMRLTLLENFLKRHEETPDVSDLHGKLEWLEATLSKFDDVQAELEVLEEEESSHYDERRSFEERYLNIVTIAHRGKSVTSKTSCKTCRASTLNMILPPIDLPRFDGKYENWMWYKSDFATLIGNEATLSNVHKLCYLKQSLSDRAANVIAGVRITDENYALAWQLLEEVYGNESFLVMRHCNLLLSTPPVESESTDSLQTFVNHVRWHLRSLALLNEPVTTWDVPILELMLSKLPIDTRIAFETANNDDERSTIEDLMKFLIQRAQTLDLYTRVYELPASPKTSKKCSRNKRSSRRMPDQPSRSGFVGTACVICNDSGHTIYRCEQFCRLSAHDRTRAVQEEDLCMNCLKPGHAVQDCRSSGCKICGALHNTLLHRANGAERASQPSR